MAEQSPRNPVIITKKLTVRYESEFILKDISLHVKAQEFVLLTGPSGCGKSTLALCLTGLIPGTENANVAGRIRVAGLDTAEHPPATLAQKVGLVFQNPATQLFNSTVEEEIAFAALNLQLPAAKIEERVRRALKATGIEHLRGRSVQDLSAGEQQRVAIASVLALRPSVLILDEPTANLDRHGEEQIMATLAQLHREEGLTIILIEHRLASAAKLATRMLLMESGRIVADGKPGTLLSDQETASRLGDLERQPDRAAPETNKAAATMESLVRLRNVTAGYGREDVLNGVNLDLYPGQFAALVGDNGAGKSTIARLLAGILRPRRGRVEWHPSTRRLRPGRRTGLLFQNPLHQLICDSVKDEVSFGPRNLGLNGKLAPLLAAADLSELQARRPQTLSVGQQQRTALSATLALRPQLLILDEPTMGQDWAHLSRLMDYLTDLYQSGQAILLITHDERLVRRYAQRIIRLAEGKIL